MQTLDTRNNYTNFGTGNIVILRCTLLAEPGWGDKVGKLSITFYHLILLTAIG